MVMRLRGRPPHLEWPVPYPYECPTKEEECPVRKIDDIENYLINLLTQKEPPPLLYTGPVAPIRPIYEVPIYMERHVYVHEADPKVEGDVSCKYPAVWVPPQVRPSSERIRYFVGKVLDREGGRDCSINFACLGNDSTQSLRIRAGCNENRQK